MNRLRFKLRIVRLLLALGAVSAVWACNAPFIPVPPPGQSFTSELVSDGAGGQKTVWVAHGEPSADTAFARVFVLDTDRGTGVIATTLADGSYQSAAMDGTRLDRVEISYESAAGEHLAAVCVQLIEGAPPAPFCP